MRVNDANSYKVYRETTPEVENDLKATQQGFSVTDQSSETGAYTRESPGDEASWGYTAPADGERHGLGSYSQAIPALLLDNEAYAIKDKSLVNDENYATKTVATEEEDTHEKLAVAQDTETGEAGIIATCLNHESQEQIFFKFDNNIKVDNINEGTANKSTKIYDIDAEGNQKIDNIGHSHDLLYVKSNIASIKTSANFYASDSKVGPIDFNEGTYPTIVTPDRIKYYPVHLVFDSGKWKAYAILPLKDDEEPPPEEPKECSDGILKTSTGWEKTVVHDSSWMILHNNWFAWPHAWKERPRRFSWWLSRNERDWLVPGLDVFNYYPIEQRTEKIRACLFRTIYDKNFYIQFWGQPLTDQEYQIFFNDFWPSGQPGNVVIIQIASCFYFPYPYDSWGRLWPVYWTLCYEQVSKQFPNSPNDEYIGYNGTYNFVKIRRNQYYQSNIQQDFPEIWTALENDAVAIKNMMGETLTIKEAACFEYAEGLYYGTIEND